MKPLLVACANGSSELLTNVASSVVSMLYNVQLMKFYGENGVSAYGVIMYVQLIFLALAIGYTMGSAPIVGYNYGAKNSAELKNIFVKSLIILSAVCCRGWRKPLQYRLQSFSSGTTMICTN